MLHRKLSQTSALWARKDLGSWTIPKGEFLPAEDPLAAARREFEEETGLPAAGPFLPLTPIRQPSGKTIQAWAFPGDCDATAIRSNTFAMEWPPRSGQQEIFPEVDRAAWFKIELAKGKIIKGQVGFLEELERILRDETSTGNEQRS